MESEISAKLYDELFVCKEDAYKCHVYCMPGRPTFYDVIPLKPHFVNETADYILQNLLKF
jgi:hypothetical protein